MNLIVNNLSIICSKLKIAKSQDFLKGINVVTTLDTINGNWVGKSSVLRSIFHTLGADGLFSDSWQREGEYIYLLDFNTDNINYLMLRKGSLFKLFDYQRKIIFSVSDRTRLSEELIKLFNQEIHLKNHNGFYSLVHPAYNYLLNYIEQKKIEPTKFQSFNNLGAFPSFYSDLIYSHLGVHNKHSNELKEEQKIIVIDKKNLNDREKTLNEMSKEIENNGGIVLDIDVLRKKFALQEAKYFKLVNDLNKHKSKMTDAYNIKVELDNLLEEIEILIKKDNVDLKSELKTHKCTRCKNLITNEQLHYFDKVKFIDGYGLQKLSMEDHLNKVNRTIELETKYYKEILKQIKQLEDDIFNESKDIKDGLKMIGLKEIAANIINKISEIKEEIKLKEERISEINKKIRNIEKNKSEVDKEYKKIFGDFMRKYSLTGIKETSFEKASSLIKVDGTHNNVVMVAWLCALLKVKYKYNPNSIRYPLIFDTPNNADLDEKNESKIFNIIFDNLPNDGQIITSLVGFDESKYKKFEINKIVLENNEYELLNERDYNKCLDRFKFLNLFS